MFAVIAAICLSVITACISVVSAGQQCPIRWTDGPNGYCYLTSGDVKTWSEARQYCQELQGDLVKINSALENEFVLALARQKLPGKKQVWIGLQRIGDRFYWADNSVPIYTHWAPREPNGQGREPCGSMWIGHTDGLPFQASAYWNDLPCDVHPQLPNGIVCKRLP